MPPAADTVSVQVVLPRPLVERIEKARGERVLGRSKFIELALTKVLDAMDAQHPDRLGPISMD